MIEGGDQGPGGDDELRQYAAQWEENSSNIWSAVDFDWTRRDLTLAEMRRLVGWDNRSPTPCGVDPQKSDLSRPVVVAFEPDDGPNLWDGVHRVVSALKLGKTVRAVVGAFNGQPGAQPRRWRLPTETNAVTERAEAARAMLSAEASRHLEPQQRP